MERHIGCSGYYYNHWKDVFYPAGLPKNKWLTYYSEHFNTVEINNTFYRMPSEKAVRNWYDITPPEFRFAVKGYRYFTHLKKLITDDDFRRYLDDFFQLAALLKEKTGPLLWQFPGSFREDLSRLENFCSLISRDFKHVFEFRHESWFNEQVYDILGKYGHGLCIVSGPASIPRIIRNTSDIAYIRFHGEGAWYRDNYSNESLHEWKEALDSLEVQTLYSYFNNDVNAFAIHNAKYLSSLYPAGQLLVK